jgi:hypothetical protein
LPEQHQQKRNAVGAPDVYRADEPRSIKNPVVIITDSNWQTADEHLIHYATEAGALLLDGMGDGVCFGMTAESLPHSINRTIPYRQTVFFAPGGEGQRERRTVHQQYRLWYSAGNPYPYLQNRIHQLSFLWPHLV